MKLTQLSMQQQDYQSLQVLLYPADKCFVSLTEGGSLHIEIVHQIRKLLNYDGYYDGYYDG